MHQWQKFGKNLSIDTGDIVETWKSGMHSVMPWPWTLTFWPQILISSSLSRDAPVTKVWQKSVNRYWRYRGNIKIWDVFGHAVTLTFDLLTQNLISSSLSRDAPVTEVWRKSVNRYRRYRGNIKLPRESRTHGRTHGRTTRKHIASAGAGLKTHLYSTMVLCDTEALWSVISSNSKTIA